MSNPLVSDNVEEKQLLLGNEAIVRGALEAGVDVVTCYPGTPSSEVPDTFYRFKDCGRYKIEYAVNEKVAMELASGAALSGHSSLVTMKHVGLNVAADPLFTTAYIGVPGAMVVLSADDPGCHSSQNEQDNRHYARAAGLPCLEPASAQEAKDFTSYAFKLSRELQQPVMLRTTTRMNHMRGPVDFGHLPSEKIEPEWKKEPLHYVPVPAVARVRHVEVENKICKAREIAENPFLTHVSGKGRLGIIASGISRAYLADALYEDSLNDKVRILELGMTWPLPEKTLESFLKSCDKVLVLEEGNSLLENEVRVRVQQYALSVQVYGKGAALTVFGEYSTTAVRKALSGFLQTDDKTKSVQPPVRELPNRPPDLCPGCAHRAVYYAVRRVFGDTAAYSSDIGCYTLGMLPPHRMADFLVCMGSSISAGSGFSWASGRKTVAFIGDSTFFHSGMTGLANAVFNKHDILVVILDNGTTAMTGHQPNPGMKQEILGDDSAHLDIEAVVRSFGVTDVAKVKSYNVRSVIKVLEDFKDKAGVRVVIAEEPCVLYARRTLKKASPQIAEVVAQGEEIETCLEHLACPAFVRQNGQIAVDPTLCSGCMVCMQIAPKSIKAHKR